MIDLPIPASLSIDFRQSPNITKGRSGFRPDLIVIHIAEGTKESVDEEFKSAASQKSAHFLVNKDGTIWQYVSSSDTAFGNGIVVNPIAELVLQDPEINPNSYSISIEHEGVSTEDINPAQYATTRTLVKYLCEKWDIPMDSTHIIRHREIEASKTCPGLINVEQIIQSVRG